MTKPVTVPVARPLLSNNELVRLDSSDVPALPGPGRAEACGWHGGCVCLLAPPHPSCATTKRETQKCSGAETNVDRLRSAAYERPSGRFPTSGESPALSALGPIWHWPAL